MSPRRAVAVYPLPGLSARAGEYVVGLVMEEFRDWDSGRGRPRWVSAVQVLGMTLRHLRRNATYVDLSEDYGVAPYTAWGYVNEMTRFLADVLGSTRAGLNAAVAGNVCLVDGSLVPVLSWRHRRDLCSGEHRRYGVNIQVVTDLYGRLIGVSRAFPGARHDQWCFEEAAMADLLAAGAGDVADSGYEGVGNGHTGQEEARGHQVAGRQRFQHRVGEDPRRRGVGFAHAKNWGVLSGRYRGDLENIDSVIQAVTGLQILNERSSGRRLAFHRGITE
jgi:hypothetical protein